VAPDLAAMQSNAIGWTNGYEIGNLITQTITATGTSSAPGYPYATSQPNQWPNQGQIAQQPYSPWYDPPSYPPFQVQPLVFPPAPEPVAPPVRKTPPEPPRKRGALIIPL
jgi:hypothetical protein